MGNGFKLRRPSPAMLVALVALFVSLGGAAYALTQIDRNSVKSKHIKSGQVKPKDLNKMSKAAWIYVSNNERINGSPGLQLTRFDEGIYRVRFPFSVRGRALLAMPTDFEGHERDVYVHRCGSAPGDSNCPSPHPNNPQTVFVETRGPGVGLEDTSFWLAAIP